MYHTARGSVNTVLLWAVLSFVFTGLFYSYLTGIWHSKLINIFHDNIFKSLFYFNVKGIFVLFYWLWERKKNFIYRLFYIENRISWICFIFIVVLSNNIHFFLYCYNTCKSWIIKLLLDTINNEVVLMFLLDWHYRNLGILLKSFVDELESNVKNVKIYLVFIDDGRERPERREQMVLINKIEFSFNDF